MNFFMEIAKLRAARLLWARLMQKNFEPKDARSPGACAPTARPPACRLTEQDPYNNVIRTTIEAHGRRAGRHPVAAHQRARRGAWRCRPSSPPASPATRSSSSQEETGIPHVVDPLGGSYYVEALTSLAGDACASSIDEVEAMGGMTKAVESGMPKLKIEEAAAQRQARIDRGEEVIVGVNKYQVANAPRRSMCSTSTTPPCASSRSRVCSRCAPAATRRHGGRRSTLSPRAARTARQSAWPAVEATRARATVGEISDALETVFTRHRAVMRSVSGVYGVGLRG